MYWHDSYKFTQTIEHDFKWAGNYGAKGEKRKKKENPTPEAVKRSNQRQKETNMRRKIKANFHDDDLWCTLKYPEGTRLSVDQYKKDYAKFIRKLRAAYKKIGENLKFVSRMEVGAKGGIHFHMLINRCEGSDKMIKTAWEYGSVNFRLLSDEPGGYAALAQYITKVPETGSEEYQQLSLFETKEQAELLRISSSKNLITPEPERKKYKRWTMRKIFENGPKATEGYYIDKDSVKVYHNPFTGYNHLVYTEVKWQERQRAQRNW